MGALFVRRILRHSCVPAILCWILLLLAAAPVLRAQNGDLVDPFYRRLVEEARTQYEQGNFAAVVQNMEVAAFGFLDSPDHLLECYIYLELAHYGLKDEVKTKFYDDKIRALKGPERLDSLKISETVAAKYRSIKAAFDKVAAGPAKAPQTKLPAPPASKTVAAPAAKIKQTAAETVKKDPPPKIKETPTQAPPEPTIPPDYLALARREADIGRKIDYYKQAVTNDPNSIEIYFELDDAYNKAARFNEAAALMELLFKYYPENLTARLRLADDWLADKSFTKAVPVLTSALRLDPDHLGIRYRLGQAYMGQRKYREALAEFEIVVARDASFKDVQALHKICVDRLK